MKRKRDGGKAYMGKNLNGKFDGQNAASTGVDEVEDMVQGDCDFSQTLQESRYLSRMTVCRNLKPTLVPYNISCISSSKISRAYDCES